MRETGFSNADIPLPTIRAIPFTDRSDAEGIELLTPDEQVELAAISTVVRLGPNAVVYQEGDNARFVYDIVSGVAHTYHLLSNGSRRITAFLFGADLFGLAEAGRYVSTAQTVTPLVAYQMPVAALERVIRRDPSLDAALLCKLCHELRHSERHAIVASQRDAKVRISTFLLSLYDRQPAAADGAVAVPMIRHDIADYLGLSMEAVSRGLHDLEAGGLLVRQARRTLRLLDIPRLRYLAGEA